MRKGDYWGDEDIDEKLPGTPKKGVAPAPANRTNAVGMEEASVGIDDIYYRTDLSHRFIWWQTKGDVENLLEQVQRVQIRRIERDVFEIDDLVKRVLKKMDGGRDTGDSGSGSESDDRGPRGGGVISRRGSRRGSGGGGRTTYESKETEIVRIPARSRAGSVRAVSQAGSVSRVASLSPPRRRSPRLRERNAESTASPVEQRPSNTARRRAARDSRVSDGAGYDYEVVRPGRDGTYVIDINSTGNRPGLRESQGQSYYRERSVTRDARRSNDRNRDRGLSRGRYDDE